MDQEKLIQKMEEELEEIGMDFCQAEIYYNYAKKGCVEAMYHLGTTDFVFDGIEPYEWLQRATEHGHKKAWFALGCQYSIPEFAGGLEDDEKEIMCYQKAADLGVAEAYYELGIHYKEGWKVELNEKKAFECFTKAAELGSTDALITLSIMYKKGNSIVEKDFEKAFEYAYEAYNKLRNQS